MEGAGDVAARTLGPRTSMTVPRPPSRRPAPTVRANAEQMAGRRQPGLIRAPPSGSRGRFEVSRCPASLARRPALPPARRSGAGGRAGGACLSRCGLGAGRGDPLSSGPIWDFKAQRRLKGGLGLGVGGGRGGRAGFLRSAGSPGHGVPSPLHRCPPRPTPEPGGVLRSCCEYDLLTPH